MRNRTNNSTLPVSRLEERIYSELVASPAGIKLDVLASECGVSRSDVIAIVCASERIEQVKEFCIAKQKATEKTKVVEKKTEQKDEVSPPKKPSPPKSFVIGGVQLPAAELVLQEGKTLFDLLGDEISFKEPYEDFVTVVARRGGELSIPVEGLFLELESIKYNLGIDRDRKVKEAEGAYKDAISAIESIRKELERHVNAVKTLNLGQ